MGSFNSVTFQEILDQDIYRAHWSQEPNVSVRHIPYSTSDDVQFGGRGNNRLTVEVLITADADIDTMRASVDGTARTLTLYSSNYSNTYLIGVGEPKRFDASANWRVPLTFMRAGT